MITEDYTSFETAKLLKEKGFDGQCHMSIGKNEQGEMLAKGTDWDDSFILCPTLQMAMKWLRDVHDLIISVNFTVHGWLCDITKVFRDSNGFIVNINHGISDDSFPYCDEHEEACEVAIKYCLENLI